MIIAASSVIPFCATNARDLDSSLMEHASVCRPRLSQINAVKAAILPVSNAFKIATIA